MVNIKRYNANIKTKKGLKITPYNKNAKKHPKKQVEQIANSIKEFGFNQPIVVDKQGVIIVGHGRYDVIVQRYVDYVDNPVVKCNGQISKLWQKTEKNP